MRSRRSLTALACAVCAFASAPAVADRDGLYSHIYYEAGYQELFGGFGWAGANARGSAIHIYERNGLVGKVAIGAVLGASLGLASPTPTTTASSSRSYQVTGGMATETTTVTTTKSDAQRASEQAALDRAAAQLRGYQPHVDLLVAFAHGDRTLGGFAAVLYPYSFGTAGFTLDLGAHYARFRDRDGPIDDAAMGEAVARSGERNFRSVGTALKVGWMPYRYVAAAEVEWLWNMFNREGDDVRTAVQESRRSQLKASVTVNPIPRAFLRGAVSVWGNELSTTSWLIEAGARF